MALGDNARAPARRAMLRPMVLRVFHDQRLSHAARRKPSNAIRALVKNGTLNGARILAPESVKLMVTATGFRNLDGWNQGLGFNGPEDLRGRQLWGHDGVDRGAATAFYFNPKTADGVIVFANANNPDFSLGYAVHDIGMHLLFWFE